MFIDVSRRLEVDTVDVDNNLLVVYTRWKDEAHQSTKFNHIFMTKKDYNKAIKVAKDITDFKTSKIMPIGRDFDILNTNSSKNNYKCYPGLYLNVYIKTFKDTGHMNFYSRQKYYWEPKIYGEIPSEDYSIMWLCGWDNYAMDDKLQPLCNPNTFLLTEEIDGYDIYNLRKHISKDKDIKIIEDQYIPGNGQSLTIIIKVKTAEEYDRFFNMDSYIKDAEILHKHGIDSFAVNN